MASEMSSNHERASCSKSAAVVFALDIIVGLFFLSANITGNVAGYLTKPTSNVFGIALLIVGLLGEYFWLKGR